MESTLALERPVYRRRHRRCVKNCSSAWPDGGPSSQDDSGSRCAILRSRDSGTNDVMHRSREPLTAKPPSGSSRKSQRSDLGKLGQRHFVGGRVASYAERLALAEFLRSARRTPLAPPERARIVCGSVYPRRWLVPGKSPPPCEVRRTWPGGLRSTCGERRLTRSSSV